MKLTQEVKAQIDNMLYVEMLQSWRFASAGDEMFQGESGEYFAKVMKERRQEPGGDIQHTQASRHIG